jgi:hypothetical protein
MGPEPQIVMNTRLPVELVRRLDAAVDAMNELEPNRRHTRSDMIRLFLLRSIEGFEPYARQKRAERRRGL